MLLSAGEIREAITSGTLLIAPFDGGNLQPASIDLTLGNQSQIQSTEPILGVKIDPENVDVARLLQNYTEDVDISAGRPSLELTPRQFVLGMTAETVGLPFDLAGRVEGRSRLARLGVGVHITAPKIDPGFRNRITLEIFNLGPWTIELTAGMRICSLLVERLGRPAESGYAGIFQGQG